MPDINDYLLKYRQEESQLLARRKKLLSQKLLVDRVFTTEAVRQRKELEQELTAVERRITDIRFILGENTSAN